MRDPTGGVSETTCTGRPTSQSSLGLGLPLQNRYMWQGRVNTWNLGGCFSLKLAARHFEMWGPWPKQGGCWFLGVCYYPADGRILGVPGPSNSDSTVFTHCDMHGKTSASPISKPPVRIPHTKLHTIELNSPHPLANSELSFYHIKSEKGCGTLGP